MVELLCGSVILIFDDLPLDASICVSSAISMADLSTSSWQLDAEVPPRKRQSLGYLSALAQGLAMVPPWLLILE